MSKNAATARLRPRLGLALRRRDPYTARPEQLRPFDFSRKNVPAVGLYARED